MLFSDWRLRRDHGGIRWMRRLRHFECELFAALAEQLALALFGHEGQHPAIPERGRDCLDSFIADAARCEALSEVLVATEAKAVQQAERRTRAH
jgi:hypothetical protein